MAAALNHLGLAEMARRIRSGAATAEAIMQVCIDRIEAREFEVGVFACYDEKDAFEAAHDADRREPVGPLHGVPFAVKDIIDTVQFPATWGTSFYSDHQPIRNASCVEHFIAAGGIPFGKTVTTELAYFKPGKTANPHNLHA